MTENFIVVKHEAVPSASPAQVGKKLRRNYAGMFRRKMNRDEAKGVMSDESLLR